MQNILFVIGLLCATWAQSIFKPGRSKTPLTHHELVEIAYKNRSNSGAQIITYNVGQNNSFGKKW